MFTLRLGDLDAIVAAGERVMELTTERTGEELEDTLRAVAPRDTHELESEIELRRINALTYALDSGAEHTKFVIEGTEERDIEAAPGSALYWPGARHPVKRVHHPGTDPNPFHERALEIEQPRVEGYAAEAAAQVRRSYG